MERPRLTIGFTHHTDFDGMYFSIQALRLNNPELMKRTQFVIVNNSPNSPHTPPLRGIAAQAMIMSAGVKYVEMGGNGTSQTRNRIFQEADGEVVLVMDCHVLLAPGALEALLEFFDDNPESLDLVHGTLLYDGLNQCATHYDNVWRAEMWGVWGCAWKCVCSPDTNIFGAHEVNGKFQARTVEMNSKPVYSCENCGMTLPDLPWGGHEQQLEDMGFRRLGFPRGDGTVFAPFEIPGQGLGLFACRKDAWLGFNEHTIGFGGEELCVHEAYRQAGRKVWCIPALQWVHRFARPNGVPYPLNIFDKVRNYVLWFNQLGFALDPIKAEFVKAGKMDEQTWAKLIADPIGVTTQAQCATCGGGPRIDTSYKSIEDVFSNVTAAERDLNQHMPKLRELAGNCSHVTEISNRRESTIAMLAGRPKIFRSYNIEIDSAVMTAVQFLHGIVEYSSIRQADSLMIASLEETDMLFIDSEHTYARLKAELIKFAPQVKRYIVMHDTDLYALKGQDGGTGMMQAIMEFTRENPAWSVLSHTTDQYGLTVLGCDKADKPKLPGPWEMAKNAAAALVRLAADGGTKVSEPEYQARLDTCAICPLRVDDRCAACGCWIAVKAALAVEKCPNSRWPNLLPVIETPKEEETIKETEEDAE